MYCSNCGKELQKDSKICPYCNTNIKVQYTQNTRTLNTKKVIIGVIIIIFIVVCGIIIYKLSNFTSQVYN